MRCSWAWRWILRERSGGWRRATSTWSRAISVKRGVVPDLVTDQTSAHDPLNGYLPRGLSLEAAAELRQRDPTGYMARAHLSMADQVRAMLAFQEAGSHVFDYGN